MISQQFENIGLTLMKEYNEGKIITPDFKNMFRAFKDCPYDKLKVVILGLDPYPGKGVADGLAFSARNNQLDPPKSLMYILEAMEKDVYGGFGIGYNPDYGNSDLTRWANQGVLLLNQSLSTHQGLTGVHLSLWYPFIQYVIGILKLYNPGLVYILLGSKAKQWTKFIDDNKNFVLDAVHPAYCAYKGLKNWDCNKVFSETNEILAFNNGESHKILW